MNESYDKLLEHWTERANPYMRDRPEMLGGLARFVEYGLQPGEFLTQVLKNNLREACAHADEGNKNNLFHVVEFCYNNLPRGCWGSVEAVDEWIFEKEISK